MLTIGLCCGVICYHVAPLPTYPQQSQALLPEEANQFHSLGIMHGIKSTQGASMRLELFTEDGDGILYLEFDPELLPGVLYVSRLAEALGKDPDELVAQAERTNWEEALQMAMLSIPEDGTEVDVDME